MSLDLPQIGIDLGIDKALAPGGLAPLRRARRIKPRTKLVRRVKPKPRFISLDTLEVAIADVPNWIVYASASAGASIEQFVGEVTVPLEPANKGDQILYSFIGLQDQPVTMILQPVLHWNLGPDALNSWSVSSWYVVRGEQPQVTTPVRVEPGAVLIARLEIIAARGPSFTYRCGFDGVGTTQKTFAGLNRMSQAVCVLEGYGIDHCNQYPASSPISWRSLRTSGSAGPMNLVWSKNDQVIDCGQHCELDGSPGSPGVGLYCR